jgi:hypothetical protein
MAIIACGGDNDNTGPTPQCHATAISVIAPTSLEVGTSIQAQTDIVSANCDEDPPVTWSSSNNGIATVSGSGLITGITPGPVVITAKAGATSGSANITITDVPVAAIEFSVGQLIVGAGNVGRVSVTLKDADDNTLAPRPLTWNSSDPTKASVDGGVITGLAPGSVAISATADGITETIDVFVVTPAVAYAWNQSASAGPGNYNADAGYQFNSTGGPGVQFSRSGTGRYMVLWGGFPVEAPASTATFISPYGGSVASCRPDSWDPAGAGISCFNHSGDVDSRHTAMQVGAGTFGGRSAYAWVDDGASSTASHPYWTSHPHGLRAYSERTGTGTYQLRFPGLGRKTPADREAIFVNAYGQTSMCQPGTATTQGEDLVVPVYCFSSTGVPANSRYTILLLDQPRPGSKVAFVTNNNPNDSHAPTNAAVRPTGTVNIDRTGVGTWVVQVTEFGRVGGAKETWMVVPNGATPAFCSVSSWSSSVNVACFTTAGAPADVPFTLIGVQ